MPTGLIMDPAKNRYLANAANPQLYYNMTSHNIYKVDHGSI